ncbi:hypothetical protein DI383_08330 [Flavobacteriaceae bacterium LYZ1037]|nr:hypothetical protein DI383_08330 [Flavobacteriaceae bacterium LYZ1037]
MCKSLLKEFRFKIGEQYELNEFNLKCLESTYKDGLELENYEYIKDDFKALFGVEFSRNIILQYNGDILSGMIYTFTQKDLVGLSEKLNNYLSLDKKLDTEKLVLGQTIVVYNNIEISITLDAERGIQLRLFKSLGQT